LVSIQCLDDGTVALTSNMTVKPRKANPSRPSRRYRRNQAPQFLSSGSLGHIPMGTLVLRSVMFVKPPAASTHSRAISHVAKLLPIFSPIPSNIVFQRASAVSGLRVPSSLCTLLDSSTCSIHPPGLRCLSSVSCKAFRVNCRCLPQHLPVKCCPVGHTSDHSPHMNEVEVILWIRPVFIHIIDYKLAVGRHV